MVGIEVHETEVEITLESTIKQKNKIMQKSKISFEEFYKKYNERDRLSMEFGKLEFERTKHILKRFLPPPPVIILDVGGGPGRYSLWLANLGYRVHLIDTSPTLLELARQEASRQSGTPPVEIHEGDARSLDFPDETADAILLFGPLYHLIERGERHRALKEAHRILKKNGLLFAAAISRFASAIDGLIRSFFTDPALYNMIKQDLADGQHRNPTENLLYFTDAFFHLPSDLIEEIREAGYSHVRVLPVEGLAVFTSNFDELWQDENYRKKIMKIVETTEDQESILGVSPHLLCVARKTGQ